MTGYTSEIAYIAMLLDSQWRILSLSAAEAPDLILWA